MTSFSANPLNREFQDAYQSQEIHFQTGRWKRARGRGCASVPSKEVLFLATNVLHISQNLSST